MLSCFNCLKKNKNIITSDTLKTQITNDIKTHIEHQINQLFTENIITHLNKSIDKQTENVKKNMELELSNHLRQLEYELITKISNTLIENIEVRVQNKINEIETNLKTLGSSIIDQYEIDLIKNIQTQIDTQNVQLNKNNDKRYRNLNNDERYRNYYKDTDEIFWGIGIENETYLEGNPVQLNGKQIRDFLGRERYSVDYLKNYNMNEINILLKEIFGDKQEFIVNRMINSHSFTKIDRNGEHRTTYEKEPKPNKNFIGLSVMDEWFNYDLDIKNIINADAKDKTNIFFDGDTIEFITDKFYKTNTYDCVNELQNIRNWFLNKFNNFKRENKIWEDLGDLRFVDKHPGFNIFRTQPRKIVLFNNSTIHFHITLPTKINKREIVNIDEFTKVHSNAIKMLQWFEPLFICSLGSPDIFQFIYEKYHNSNDVFYSKGSMRATLSRYIGIGTYDYNTMKIGKLLNTDIESVRPKLKSRESIWWRDKVKNNMLYVLPENDIGLDFNFNKHHQSGFEFRILDGIPMDILKNVLDVILLICNYSYIFPQVINASEDIIWNDLVYTSMSKGYQSIINKDQMTHFLNILNLEQFNNNILGDCDEMLLDEFYFKLLNHIFYLSKQNDYILTLMTKDFIDQDTLHLWDNFNKIQCLNHIECIKPVS